MRKSGGRTGTLTTPASNCNITAVYTSTSTTTTTATTTIASATGSIYCVGGVDAASTTAHAFYAPVYGATLGNWTETSTYPVSGYDLDCAALSNGNMYCTTLIDSGGNAQAYSYYAPMTTSGLGAWASSTSYP